MRSHWPFIVASARRADCKHSTHSSTPRLAGYSGITVWGPAYSHPQLLSLKRRYFQCFMATMRGPLFSPLTCGNLSWLELCVVGPTSRHVGRKQIQISFPLASLDRDLRASRSGPVKVVLHSYLRPRQPRSRQTDKHNTSQRTAYPFSAPVRGPQRCREIRLSDERFLP